MLKIKFSLFCFLSSVMLCAPVLNAKPKCGDVTKIVGKDTIVLSVECYKEGGWSISHLKNGKLHGKCESFYSNGTKMNVDSFYNGNQEGINRGWLQDGFLSVYKPYRNGHSVDTHKLWYDNKKRQSVDIYDTAGERHGWSMAWDSTGVLLDSVFYTHGEMTESYNFWSSGKLMCHQKTKGNKETGRYDILQAETYNSNGKKNGEIKDGNGRIIVLRTREYVAFDTISVKNGKVQEAGYYLH